VVWRGQFAFLSVAAALLAPPKRAKAGGRRGGQTTPHPYSTLLSRFARICSAPTARSQSSSPRRVLDRLSTPNAFGEFKAPDASRRISSWACTAMNRAFSAGDLRCINSWGVAPGSDEPAPLARNMYVRRRDAECAGIRGETEALRRSATTLRRLPSTPDQAHGNRSQQQ